MLSTPVTRYLQQRKISYRILMQNQATASVQEAAVLRGINPEIMVKSIVLRDMGGQYALACCPGNESIDPKKVRSILSTRRMTCASRDETEMVTGSVIGTVTPLLLRETMPIIFDTSLQTNSMVTISSGDKRAGLMLLLQDLEQCCRPAWGNIIR
ncbi:aminoacyl-tRNA deacylase [Vibrio sp. 10N.261.51.F12]|uniref:aminoacyl-tRNA deacylase n=1 Tax=Vibrio sp. 10N.261.51.F12 TaxID=3229679 RepID=UPI0035512869